MEVKHVAEGMASGDAMRSLGRTDDMLAVIGIIMLLGVIISSYGEYWQGVYAKASYKNQCNCPGSSVQQGEDHKKLTTEYIIGVSIISLAVIAVIVYIFKRNKHHAPVAGV